MEKTNKYSQFIFVNTNRNKIHEYRVKELMESIKQENFLHLKPILVNKKMEVMDGNHRLLAAQALKVDIYYVVDDVSDSCMLAMQNSKQWINADYLNFYVRKGKAEYIKLLNFMKLHSLSMTIAMKLCSAQKGAPMIKFRTGEFLFSTDTCSNDILICQKTIEKVMIHYTGNAGSWCKSAKFWISFSSFIRHPLFDDKKWFNNLNKLMPLMGPKVSSEHYVSMFEKIYNHRNPNPIENK